MTDPETTARATEQAKRDAELAAQLMAGSFRLPIERLLKKPRRYVGALRPYQSVEGVTVTGQVALVVTRNAENGVAVRGTGWAMQQLLAKMPHLQPDPTHAHPE